MTFLISLYYFSYNTQGWNSILLSYLMVFIHKDENQHISLYLFFLFQPPNNNNKNKISIWNSFFFMRKFKTAENKRRTRRRSSKKKREKLSFRSQGSEGKSEGKIIMCLFLTIFTSEALEKKQRQVKKYKNIWKSAYVTWKDVWNDDDGRENPYYRWLSVMVSTSFFVNIICITQYRMSTVRHSFSFTSLECFYFFYFFKSRQKRS